MDKAWWEDVEMGGGEETCTMERPNLPTLFKEKR